MHVFSNPQIKFPTLEKWPKMNVMFKAENTEQLIHFQVLFEDCCYHITTVHAYT